MMTDMTIAKTIRSQIGGGAMYMLGAKDVVGHESALSFRVRGSREVNHIKVELEASDTYKMTFTKIGRSPSLKQLLKGATQKITTVAEVDGVYCDMLRPMIKKYTGLNTSL